MAAGRQIRLLLWKDYLIRKRNLITLAGIVWAVCVMSSLYIIRLNVNNNDYPTCQFPARALPSAGLMTFLQSFICSVDNTCSPMDQFVEIPSYEKSKLTEVKSKILPLVSNDTLLDVAGTLPDGLKLLATLAEVADNPTFVDLSRNGLRVDNLFRNPKRVRRYLITELGLNDDVSNSIVDAKISLEGVMQGKIDRCDVNSISKVLKIENKEHSKIFVNKLCKISNKVLQKLVIDLLKELDVGKYVKMIGEMYYKLSGDDRIQQLGDMATAVLRMMSLDSFLPAELTTLLKGEEVDFTYINFTMVTKALDHFKPVFGETEVYKSIRNFAETSIIAVKYLYRIASKKYNNTAESPFNLTLANVEKNMNVDLELDKLSNIINEGLNMMEDIFEGDSSENIFNVLSKLTNFIYNFLSAKTKHNFLFFSTLAAKLIEGAELVVNINMNIEQVVYNVSQRNPEGVKVLLALPPNIVSIGLEALADPERIKYLTDKMDDLEKMFCEIDEIHSFFNVSKEEATKLHVNLCTDAWNKYMMDMLTSFGIFEVRDNINSIARLFVLQTVGRDVTEFLYTIDQDFDILKNFSRTLSKVEMRTVPNLNWSRLLGIDEDSEILKNAREKSHLGNQVLITVNGALAKEVVRQSPLLEYKISNPLIDVTAILIAVNKLLAAAPADVIKRAREAYPEIIETILLTALDEEKTYRALATPSEDMLCNGVEHARSYFTFPPSVELEEEELVSTLCNVSSIINAGLQRNSLLGEAIASVKNTTHGPFDDIDWSLLITELKKLYVRLDSEYPYLFEYKTYGMDNKTKDYVEEMFEKTQQFWFSKKNANRGIHVSIKVIFRMLDVLDSSAFNLTGDKWLRLKSIFTSVTGPLDATGDFLELLGAISRNDNTTSKVPAATEAALRSLLPNLPILIVDSVDVVTRDDTDIEHIITIMNSEPPWPCAHNLSKELLLREKALEAMEGLETILCMDPQFQKEWADYMKEKNLTTFDTQDFNTTVYPPHMFLKFSEVFTDSVKDLETLKYVVQRVFASTDGISFVSSIEYAIDSFGTSERRVILRNFFSNLDKVLNSLNTTSVDQSMPLNAMWRSYFRCMPQDDCGQLGRAVWIRTLMMSSVMLDNMAADLLTYFKEANEESTNVLKVLGFTSNTGLYTLYDRFPQFVVVLLNSYWDLAFMNQVRRASLTEFWDCEAVVAALVPPPGSPIDEATIDRVRPYICPSLLYWISFPRGDNILLDVVAKPQYFFFTMQADNLTSSYENAFNKTSELTDFLTELSKKPVTIYLEGEDSEDMGKGNKLDKMRYDLEQTADKVLSFKINETNASYRLFNEISKQQFISSIYLTRIAAITYKLSRALNDLNVDEVLEGISKDDVNKTAVELTAIQRIFKRRPTEAIALHFDVITDVLWTNAEGYNLVDGLTTMCDNFKNKDITKDILSDTDRVKLQICSKSYDLFYTAIQNVIDEDMAMARDCLLNFVRVLQNDDAEVTEDIYKLFNDRPQLVNSLKRSVSYAYELGLPIYVQYQHSNVLQYGVVVSLLSGEDWWGALRTLYRGPHVSAFLDAVERSFDVADDILNNLDKINLVRLIRDMNTKHPDGMCRDSVSLRDYVPDGTGLLSSLREQACSNSTQLYGEIPPMLFASQGYVSDLKLSNEIDDDQLNSDLKTIESKLANIMSGPKEPVPPAWVTDEKMAQLKTGFTNLLSREPLTKISFGVLSNLVDAGTLFLNNSECTLCSPLTTWFKQINLQLYKKPEYDNLLCLMDQLDLEQIHQSLKNDFHWDMAISEIVSSRNYTNYELNKSMNEFLELVKLHVLEDAAGEGKVAQCLAGDVTGTTLGNATLFGHVLARTIRLFRAELPHLQEVPGITNLTYFKKLQADIAHNLDVEGDLTDYLKKDQDLSRDIMNIVGDKDIVEDIKNAKINLRTVRDTRRPMSKYLGLRQFNWTEICGNSNCDEIAAAVDRSINSSLIERNLPLLQKQAFWRFGYIADMLEQQERLAGLAARLLGAAGRADLPGVADGRLLPTIDLTLQLLTDQSLDTMLYSLRGGLQQLQPFLTGTSLEYDVTALASGLAVIRQFKSYLLEEDLQVAVSDLFPDPDRLEASLTDLGINNTNFWSIAAPRIQAGHIMLAPIFAPKHGVYRIESFLCSVEDMAEVIVPGDLDVVTPDDVFGAVVEQFCGLTDKQAKEILPVLAQNMNYTFIMDKVKAAVIAQMFSASNLSEQEGNNVLSHFTDMASVLPSIQGHLKSVADSLADEPLLRKFRNTSSINSFISSSSFMADAGKMMCGQAFEMNINRYYKVISDVQDQSGNPDEAQLEVLPTEFCRSLYKEIVHMKGGKIVWSFAKPLILGKILYTPDTPLVQRIIQQASKTFEPAVKVSNLIHSFAAAFFSIEKLTAHKDGITVLRELLSSPEYEGLRKNLVGDVDIRDIDVDGLIDGLGDIQGYKSMLSKASDLLRCINLDRFQPVKDENELKLQAGRLTRVNEFSAGVVFLNEEKGVDIPDNIEYKIRMDIENSPTTRRIRNYLWIPGPEANFLENMRYFRGFVQIQDIIDNAIIELSADDSRRQKRAIVEKKDFNWAVYTQQIPYPCFRQDQFQTSLYETQSLMVGFFFSMLFTVASAVRLVVADKESGNTMLMSIMGVKLRHHTLSWFLVSLVEVAATVVAITGVLVLGGVLPRTEPTLLLAILMLYGFSVVCFCYMMSKLFSAASIAAVCTALALLLTYMPFVLILSLEDLIGSPLKIFVCLFMSSSMTYGMWFVTRFEAMGRGAHWGQLWDTMEGSEMTMAYAMLMVFADGLLYIVIGYLLDRLFGFQTRHNNINCSTTGEKAGVSIVNVSKVYHEGTRRAKRALDNVSVELEQGQITTLLGHNGAGKTTLINILTGMLKPSKGHVVVRSEHAAARLGVCPQKDVLFNHLTAREHVTLYARLKSDGSADDVKDEVESILRVLSLGAVCEEPVARLSGGTRRRLCVALAFVARPSLVSLDEPTSGVDPAARREIWSMIMKLRENRTILLTTHHLDEAELLSDQIVIMHKGQIHTTGSPIDIKRSLGTGYKLTVMFPDRRLHIEDAELDEELCIEEKTKQLLAVTRGVIKNASLVDVNGSEVEVNLPFYDADGVSNNFLELCKALETDAQALGYRNFALDCSSLEQVFFQICQQAEAPKNTIEYEPSAISNLETASKSASGSSIKTDREPLVPAGPLRGSAAQQFMALLRARYLHYIRNKWLLFSLIILPSLFVATSMAFSTIRPPADTEVALKLHRNLYEPTTDFIIPQPSVYPSDSLNEDDTLAQRVMDILKYEKEYRNWTRQDSPSCQCVDNVTHQCDVTNTTIDRPKMMVLPDVDTLNNWLINSHQQYIQRRYGGFSSSVSNNVSRLVAWYNNKGHHALPVYLNALAGARLRAAASRARITTYTHPLKISTEQLSRASAYQHVADAGISSMLLLGYSLVTAGGAVYIVAARRRQEKRLQLLAGVSPALYWSAALAFDMIIILLNLGVTVVVLVTFRFPVFVFENNLAAICILIVLYGYSGSCLMHVLEKLFAEPSMASMILFCGNVFLGVSGITLLLILDIISESEATDNARWVLHKVFLACPQFVLGDGLLEIATNTIQATVLKQFGMDTYQDPLTSSLLRNHYLAMVVSGTLLLLLNLAIEYDYFEVLLVRFSKPPPALVWGGEEPEEAEVRRERARVRAALEHAAQPLRLRTIGNINAGFVETEEESKGGTVKRGAFRDVAACEQLGRAYRSLAGPRLAVQDLTLGIPPGQCTALLGQNGAGKSTTFAMLTGEVRPTVGHVHLDDRRVDSRGLCTGYISYCPQSDAVDPLLTVSETLALYCQLRGIPRKNQVIRRTLETFELTLYAGAAAGALSGGNRRKLCSAIAFMGRSPLVLLDEPTSGMDPASRACVSRAVRAACGGGRAVLLSTHALDDARRLAARVALVRAGRLCALAPLDQCLRRFGGGYVVACRVRRGGARAAWARVRARAPHAVLRVLHRAAVHFLLPAVAIVDKKQVTTQLSDVFALMAELQAACEIDDYTVNQSSLDQMFLNFTEKTKDGVDPADLEGLPEARQDRRSSDDLDSVTAL